ACRSVSLRLIRVRVPTAHLGESHFQPNACLDQLRYLLQRPAELRRRIYGTVLRLVLSGVRRLQEIYRFKGIFPGLTEGVLCVLLVNAFESALEIGGVAAG